MTPRPGSRPPSSGSPGVPRLWHDVAPEGPADSFRTHLQGCGARCRCCLTLAVFGQAASRNTAVSTTTGAIPAARLPLSSGQPLFIRDCDPPREVSVTRHQQGFTVIHPTPAFPSPVTPGGTGALGFSLSFEPRRAGPGGARQGGDRPGHCLDYVPDISQPPSTYSLTTCDLTSH